MTPLVPNVASVEYLAHGEVAFWSVQSKDKSKYMENATKETDMVEHKQWHINKQQDTSRTYSRVQNIEKGSRLMSTSLPPPPHRPQSIRQVCLFPPATGAQVLPLSAKHPPSLSFPYHHRSSLPISTHHQSGIHVGWSNVGHREVENQQLYDRLLACCHFCRASP